MRGDCAAPTFNPVQPRTLRRYFKDLELLFTRCKIEPDGEKKRYTRSYAPIKAADMWKMLPMFATGTYQEFKDAIFALYPGAGTVRRWTRNDLWDLVAHTY